KAFKEADYTIEDQVKIQRFTGAALEPRSYVANYDKTTGKLTFYASTQQPHPLRTLLSETLGLSESHIHVIQPAVGGGFGLKIPPFQDELLVAFLSMKTGRPVKFTEERRENFLAGGHARSQKHYFAVAFNKDGKVVGLRDKIIADAGVLFPTPGWGMPIVTAIHIPTVYKIPNVDVELNMVVTNKNALNAYRGFGKECASFLMERIMDLIARKLGMGRAEVRFKNFIQPDEFPYELSSAATLDSGNYPAALQKALNLFSYEEMLKEQSKARAAGRLYGLGIAYELTPEGGCIPGSFFQQYDGVTLKVSPTGKVAVFTGITSPGSGQETAIAQIVADELGAKLEDITVIQGDTDACPYGLGNFSGRSMITGGIAAASAAGEVKAKLLKVAASMLEVAPQDLEAKDSRFSVVDSPHKSLTLAEVATAIYRHPYDTALEVEPGLEVTRYFKMPNARHIPDARGYTKIYTSFPNSAHVCAVEVDGETGQVKILKYAVIDDCGKVINPMIVEGQLHGGLAQGIGGTFYEDLIYDENGQLLTTTFMDYPIPTAQDLPNFILGHQETLSPYNPL
ncbi:MAG: xanthine dehydrogenase family protein molybdopterin-binding subunit, partial [Candidatus Bathyarchaeia archaeon]